MIRQTNSIEKEKELYTNEIIIKNKLKELNKTLRALINLIKANYPDTYKAELRTWGFQKEKY